MSIQTTIPSPDIITDILCRLPVKSLLRFRCASKPWCSQIDSSDFIKLHLNHSLKTNTNLSLILRDVDLFSIDLDTLDKAVKLNNPIEDDNRGNGTEVVGSCNGLIALFNSDEDIALWNPYTKRHQKLPIAEIEFPPSSFIYGSIYGFGYDPVTDDFKIVRLVQFYEYDDHSIDSEVKVYSLKANLWKRIQVFPYYIPDNQVHGVLVSNALHWIASRKPDSDSRNVIMAFDLRTEDCFEVPQPDDVGEDFHSSVGVLGGCLCVICNYFNVRVDIWVMKEYGMKESWIKEFSVAQKEVISGFGVVGPLAYSKSGDKVLLHKDNKKFVWYDLKWKRAEKIRIDGAPRSFEVEMCVASLVPLSRPNVMKQQPPRKKKNNKSGKKRDDFLSHGFKLVL